MVDLKHKVEFQYRTIIQMEKTCKDIQSRVDALTDKANRLGKKYDKGVDVKVQTWWVESVSKDNQKNDREFYPENIYRACNIKFIKEGTIERI